MTLDEMIAKLNQDLCNEYRHWHFYMQAMVNVQGLHREEVGEFLKKEATGEMTHVEEFKRLIIGLGGMPTINVAPFAHDLTTPKDILEYALAMEDEVVSNYVYRIDDAIVLQDNGGKDKVDGKYIELFLEEQVLDSRADADHIREMLKGV